MPTVRIFVDKRRLAARCDVCERKMAVDKALLAMCRATPGRVDCRQTSHVLQDPVKPLNVC